LISEHIYCSLTKDTREILKQEFKGFEKVKSPLNYNHYGEILIISQWRLMNRWKNSTIKFPQLLIRLEAEDNNETRNYWENFKKHAFNIWLYIAIAIEESKYMSKLCFYELMASLKTHNLRRNTSSNKGVEQAFQSKLTFSKKWEVEKEIKKDLSWSHKIEEETIMKKSLQIRGEKVMRKTRISEKGI